MKVRLVKKLSTIEFSLSLEHWHFLINGLEIVLFDVNKYESNLSIFKICLMVTCSLNVRCLTSCIWNDISMRPSLCLLPPVPIIQVFILFLVNGAQGLLGSSKSRILGQGRGCAWDILLFLEGNVSLNNRVVVCLFVCLFLKKRMTKD